MLWFDVGIDRYTAQLLDYCQWQWLWFDVGIDRYTAGNDLSESHLGCGLM